VFFAIIKVFKEETNGSQQSGSERAAIPIEDGAEDAALKFLLGLKMAELKKLYRFPHE